MTTYYDNHTLFVRCDCATLKQIKEVFNEALETYQKDNGILLDCKYRINLVENKEKQSLGIAFVHFSNPEVYNMIIGKNFDGTDRVEYIDDPTSVKQQQNDWSITDIPKHSINWADDDDYIPQKKIPVPLEPLIKLPPYTLTEEQIENKKQKIITDNSGKQDFDISLVKIASTAYLSIDRAIITKLENKYMPNILKCVHVPNWISKDDIKQKFIPYVSDSKTIQDRNIKGRRFKETYPFVNINNDGVAFIIFDPSTHDAQFALHMTKKLVFQKYDKNNKLLSTTLRFGHSYRTDRDTMTDINKRPKPMINDKIDNRFSALNT
jgi:hypothetical protein